MPLHLAKHPHKTSTHTHVKLHSSIRVIYSKEKETCQGEKYNCVKVIDTFFYIYMYVCIYDRDMGCAATKGPRWRPLLTHTMPGQEPRAQLPLRMSMQGCRCWDEGLVDALFSWISLEGSGSLGEHLPLEKALYESLRRPQPVLQCHYLHGSS